MTSSYIGEFINLGGVAATEFESHLMGVVCTTAPARQNEPKAKAVQPFIRNKLKDAFKY